MKQIYSFKFDPELLKELQREAKKENRSFNNYVETLLFNHPERILKNVRIINKSLPGWKKLICDICDGTGWYGDDELNYNCSKCNPNAASLH